jgi:hypothetical protein|tara:strand:- start:457 stop:642 length:186 start_codon:yes stop_codon:yes gene_type:complete
MYSNEYEEQNRERMSLEKGYMVKKKESKINEILNKKIAICFKFFLSFLIRSVKANITEPRW